RQPGIDPVGCCVGLRGIRIQNIVSELSGEKIDVVLWNADPFAFIASSLSPAQIVAVELNKADGQATVIVPDRQLSLAIGKEGQNARLAAKLTGWRIDIKPASVYEAERAAAKPAEDAAAAAAEQLAQAEPVMAAVSKEAAELPAEEETEEVKTKPVIEEAVIGKPVNFEQKAKPGKVEIRFAEDILGPKAAQPEGGKANKKKKKGSGKSTEEEGARPRKGGRRQEFVVDDEEGDTY
ncbi:MAG TPA: transcription termination/antitermination protein NusA, partial [Dehalococcoidales bacterium]|nr:transcription termination/antitermination protein NusA [Dehalococcoidales bacterium]